MTELGGWKSICALLVLCNATAIASHAQTFTTLYTFCLQSGCTDGDNPKAGLVQARDGNLYGTTLSGGANGFGTVFKITPSGTLTTLYSFCPHSGCTDGQGPSAGLIQATDGNFYGTTVAGGASHDGTVFKITPSGTLTTLHSFDGTDGSEPFTGLVQATDGNFYGTTRIGGGHNDGTVFKITPSGTLTTLHSFDGTDGLYPQAELVQATNGNFYGTTPGGGASSDGTVFKITPSGTLTTLYSFCPQSGCTDGGDPQAGLVQATNGNLYGTTATGGAHNDGTVFKITPSGMLTTLHSFDSTDGADSFTGLVQATDGNLYGTTFVGGASNQGSVFKITPSGTLTTLYSFCSQSSCTDGTNPYARLVQDTSGTFYGTTDFGGTTGGVCGLGCGTVFSLSTGLGAFVNLAKTSGKEGAKIGMLGQGFSSSSVVKFGGTKATTVTLSGTTFLTATVPSGALTGPVTVTTGSTTLTSSKIFRVTPTITSFSPPSGPVGTLVTINGTGLMQATKVTFNGTSASFTVVSDIETTATVPTGATTGKIVVTTKGGSATSATVFTVN